MIATYGIFAAGVLMRPLGAAVFGWFGDRYGRARTMQISVVMMAVPTLLLGLILSYATAGVTAPARFQAETGAASARARRHRASAAFCASRRTASSSTRSARRSSTTSAPSTTTWRTSRP
jgi:MFS family permease